MLEKLVAEDFSKHINGEFLMFAEETEQKIPLQLIQVDILGEPMKKEAWGKMKNLSERAPFSLVFRGPKDVMYPQLMRPVAHPEMGEIPLFLVPIDEDEDGYYYESIFN